MNFFSVFGTFLCSWGMEFLLLLGQWSGNRVKVVLETLSPI